MSNWIFFTYLTMEFCLFFSSKLLFRMDFWYEFKSCPFQTSCQTESLVAYLTMEPCVLFHPKIWIFDQNSSLVLKSGCQIESFVSYRTMEFSFRATYEYGFVWIFVQYGFQYGYEFKSCYTDVKLNLLLHISQCNFVCCFIQS